MGVVVLDAERGQVELHGELRGQVLGVEVVGDDLRLHPVERTRWSSACTKTRWVARCSRSPMWWLGTTMLPLATLIVLFSSAPTASTWRRRDERQGEGLWRVAPRAAQDLQPRRRGSHHRVVAPDVDGPVMGEQAVGDRSEASDARRRRRGRWVRR